MELVSIPFSYPESTICSVSGGIRTQHYLKQKRGALGTRMDSMHNFYPCATVLWPAAFQRTTACKMAASAASAGIIKVFFIFLFFFFYLLFFFFIDCSYIYKHYINSVIITLLTDIIKTNNTLRTTVTIQCKLTLLEIKEKKELTNTSLSYTL